ncbi:MAG: GEVED domain-containing protein, partial [Planctomycetota bacterium]|nr:GEVED domain-containing protein [Planctomycetota bacterium]
MKSRRFKPFWRRRNKRRKKPARSFRRLEPLEARILLAADFGDAPRPYLTTLLEGGPHHEATGPTLGGLRDTEADGQPSATAAADEDEDGVTFGTIMVGALDAAATVNVKNAPGGAKLDAWIDFNADGSWGGPFEQIANNVAVVDGDNTIRFDVPSWAVDGTTYARFRLSTAGN